MQFTLSTGSTLKIPIEQIRQASYCTSAEKPAEIPLTDPLVVLRTGDRLAFANDALALTFQTPHGSVQLPPAGLLSAELDLPDGSVHRVFFRNGSRLSGILGPDMLSFKLRLGPTLKIERQKLRRLLLG